MFIQSFISKISILAVSVALLQSSLSYADSKDITVVETRKIIENSLAHKGILSQIQKKNEEFRAQVQKAELSLKKKHQELESQKNALSKEALDKKNDELSKEVAELQKKSYEQHDSLEDAYRNATQTLLDKTSDIVKQSAGKNGHKIVIEKAAVVFAEDTLDITDTVLTELNKQIPNIEVTFKGEEPKKVTTTEQSKQ